MDIDAIREYCLTKPGQVREGMPFGGDVLVFKVNGKIFLLTTLSERPLSISLKCDPAKAIELREQFDAVQPGYHLNKKHWNTVTIDGSISSKEIFSMIDHSFDLVANARKKPGSSVKRTRKRKR